MKKNILAFALLLGSYAVQAQIGIGVPNPAASAALEVSSITKGLLPPRLTTAQRNAIASPGAGLIIYNTTKNCMEWYNGTGWYNGCGNQDVSSTSNGTAIVSAYTCSTASAGTMTVGIAVSGVTQTITATVITVGTYSISAVANGVTFAGTGAFIGTGSQNVVLTATGTPTAVGSNSFVLNTTPNCSFSRVATCGAFVAAGVYKVFMCHNLGATTTLDPNVPVQGIHGNYYQWGRSTVVADASTPSGVIAGWNSTAAANGSWSDASKTANDPCPAGFRVPTGAQWDGVIANNTVSRTGSWVNNNGNFTTAIHWGASTKTLTLPAAGTRGSGDGSLLSRGSNGGYWSSTVSGTFGSYLSFISSNAFTNSGNRVNGYSVRCVSE